MEKPKKKKRKSKKKRKVDPNKLVKLRQKRKLRSLFARIGFSHIPSDGIEFTFDGRTGELDDVFLQENVLVICEYTTGKATSEHVSKKAILFDKILTKSSQWITEYSSANGLFAEKVKNSNFTPTEFKVRIVYASLGGVSAQMESSFPALHFLDGTRLRYFELLSHTIHKSARHEFFKYLKIEYSEVGKQIYSPQNSSRSFPGHLLPEQHSSYPPGFKVVSFYADPENLLQLSYVLRQDSWRDKEGLYQRILIKNKIAGMRRYLAEVKRVFVNNIIVTLPPNTNLNDPRTGKNIDASGLDKAAQISVSVPYGANMIGLVDGQHRVFCYYEGSDKLESQINELRKRQNLLVTGLIFPSSWVDSQKREFEAKLFLEINDNQAKAKSALKQSIELILNPFSTIAIAKEITNQLSDKGPLAELLQTSFFDPPEKIKTTSIVSYGLRPLVKFEGPDSLFSTWTNPEKVQLADGTTATAQRRVLLDAYLKYCVEGINAFLLAAKMKTGPDKWKLMDTRKDQFLTPTVINGLFVCIRRLAENQKLSTREQYERRLAGIESFNFSKYRSSGWRALGDKLYQMYFEK